MKIRVSYVVDVDVDAWNADFGTDASTVRDDVKARCEYLATEQLREDGHLR